MRSLPVDLPYLRNLRQPVRQLRPPSQTATERQHPAMRLPDRLRVDQRALPELLGHLRLLPVLQRHPLPQLLAQLLPGLRRPQMRAVPAHLPGLHPVPQWSLRGLQCYCGLLAGFQPLCVPGRQVSQGRQMCGICDGGQDRQRVLGLWHVWAEYGDWLGYCIDLLGLLGSPDAVWGAELSGVYIKWAAHFTIHCYSKQYDLHFQVHS